MTREIPDRTAEAIELLKTICLEKNIAVSTVRARVARQEVVEIRRQFCKQARALKIGVVPIGIAINRDHTTVTYHSNQKTFLRKRAKRPKGSRP